MRPGGYGEDSEEGVQDGEKSAGSMCGEKCKLGSDKYVYWIKGSLGLLSLCERGWELVDRLSGLAQESANSESYIYPPRLLHT